MDRNNSIIDAIQVIQESLSARRAWIEITPLLRPLPCGAVALRKESVDRNSANLNHLLAPVRSLSARRAWIEIDESPNYVVTKKGRSPQGERG